MLKETDKEIAKLMKEELKKQQQTINLIASENIASKAVLEAQASVLINKYSEGYPYKRYYAGNRYADEVETLAIERAKRLFGAEHANVQCYSGSPANLAIYFAFLEIGDKVMAMDLAQGGHLTHGSPVNFTGKAYNFMHYGVDHETEMLDYDAIRKQAIREKPKMIVSGATAYPRIIDFKRFSEIAEEVGAYSMADISHIAGLVSAGVHPSPFPFTDVVMTTTHKTLRGPRGAIILCKKEFAEKIDRAVFPGMQGGPHDHTTAAKAVAFLEDMQPGFKEYARQIVKNAKALAKALTDKGFRPVSGGTDNHLILIDLRPKKVAGKDAQNALEKAGIIVNKNTIPFDTGTPFNPSGIRLGTPALTTRGMKEPEMKQVADMIARVIDNMGNEEVAKNVREEVIELTKQFPIYEDQND